MISNTWGWRWGLGAIWGRGVNGGILSLLGTSLREPSPQATDVDDRSYAKASSYYNLRETQKL